MKFISVPDFDLCSLIFAVHFLGMADKADLTQLHILVNIKNWVHRQQKQEAQGTPESSFQNNLLFKTMLGIAKAK